MNAIVPTTELAVDDDFHVTSQNPDADAVRASLAEAPVAPEASEPTEAEDDDSAGTAEPATEPVAEAVAEADGGKKKSPQQRIAHLTWEREEARREAAALKARIEALERGPAPVAAPPPPTEDEPQHDDFDTYEAYTKALARWEVRQEFAQQRAAEAAQQRHVQELDVRRGYAAREATFAETVPDYRDALQRASHLPVTPVMQAAMLGSDKGPALAYFLATHPEEATQLAQRTYGLDVAAASMVRELMESKLPSAPASSGSGSRVTVTVPPPITPVGASPVVAETPIHDLPVDDYSERANALEAAERRKRRGQ